MRSARQAFLTVLLAASTAGSAEPDGAVAGPLRWPDPRGTVSGSRRSTALPVTRARRKVWEFRPEGFPISAPPVHWDGRLYLLGGIAGDQKLFAVDLFTGEMLSRKSIKKAPTTYPVVWDHRVYLRTKLDEISVLRPSRKSFKRVWHFKPKLGELSDPIVFQGEVYTLSDSSLVRLREGKNSPVWNQSRLTGLHGRPALYGNHVYVLAKQDTSLHLCAVERADGRLADKLEAAPIQKYFGIDTARRCGITVLENRVYLNSAFPLAAKGATLYNAGVGRQTRGERIAFCEPVRLYQFATSPAVHRDGLVALSDDRELAWVIWQGKGGAMLASEKAQPDFFLQRVAPTVVGDVVYFGTWAADVKTLDVLWRLPHERLRFPVVPADRMIVVVDSEGGVIAYAD